MDPTIATASTHPCEYHYESEDNGGYIKTQSH